MYLCVEIGQIDGRTLSEIEYRGEAGAEAEAVVEDEFLVDEPDKENFRRGDDCSADSSDDDGEFVLVQIPIAVELHSNYQS